jgi:hypothetical protein
MRLCIMAAPRLVAELTVGEERGEADGDDPIANRTGEPGRAGADAFGLSSELVFLCGGITGTVSRAHALSR